MQHHQAHWEKVYATKQPSEVSWTQEVPATSLEFFHQMNLPKSAKIIDIGGGDSRFVDHLLAEGFEQISVLDISKKAIARAKKRLGKAAQKVNWVVSDVTNFSPDGSFDLWHDRATFHFLTTKEQVSAYLDIVERAVSSFLIIATFSETGPKKCSGLDIQQYSQADLEEQFRRGFDKIRCKSDDHITPFQTVQNFTFCSFSKHSS